ncbi:hypothetical protein AB0K12_17070 [Nonomuraea sp. NPDC049419]|uniref:hypothetical protein n=1 Tax=Nonomuraea sp. NPDC049419 TaxID=3155772 RepID=UPI00343DFFA2
MADASNLIAAATPADRVLAYVLTDFELITGAEHALATVLAELVPGDTIAEQSRAMHAHGTDLRIVRGSARGLLEPFVRASDQATR